MISGKDWKPNSKLRKKSWNVRFERRRRLKGEKRGRS
jgi:hypothetical protein